MTQVTDTNWITKFNYVLTPPDFNWLENEVDQLSRRTPIAKVFGFQTSEEAYDMLNLNEQIILDLTSEGYNQTEIAYTLNISQPTVSITYRRIAYKLADTKLRLALDIRNQAKEWTE